MSKAVSPHIALEPWEKEIEARLQCPSVKPTFHQTLLGVFGGLALFATLSSPKRPLPVPKRLLSAVGTPLVCFMLHKALQIRQWKISGKEKLLEGKDLSLKNLGKGKDLLTVEERAFLIRKDFWGDTSYTDLLNLHGEEEVAALFAKGRNSEYRDKLKEKFLDEVESAQDLDSLMKIASFPDLKVSVQEYLDKDKLLSSKDNTVWDKLKYCPNYDVLRLLIDNKQPPTVFNASYDTLLREWTEQNTFQSQLCLNLILDGQTEIHKAAQEKAWELIPKCPAILPKLYLISAFKPGKWEDLMSSDNQCSVEQLIQLIKYYNLELNPSDTSNAPLVKAFCSGISANDWDANMVEALIKCGAIVSSHSIISAMSVDASERINALMASSFFDINRYYSFRGEALSKPPIVQAILDKKQQIAQFLWKQPNLTKIKWNEKDLKQLAREYRITLEEVI